MTGSRAAWHVESSRQRRWLEDDLACPSSYDISILSAWLQTMLANVLDSHSLGVEQSSL
jgi:hypothetical protein